MIVGYTFAADNYCPEHVIDALPTSEGGVHMSVEDNLDELAAAFGIDRTDESSFDSGNFPKIITKQQAEHDAGWGADVRCGRCGSDLLDRSAF